MAQSSFPELDFFTMANNNPKPTIFERRRSFRDIQSVISKMNPEIVKSVIENGSLVTDKSPHISTPKPACDPTLRLSCGYEENGKDTAPMTIFYNGRVTVFDVSPHKAQGILKVAEERLPKSAAECSQSTEQDEENLLESLNEDLPIPRKMSLQRFLEKRKERLIVLSPYYFPPCYDNNSR